MTDTELEAAEDELLERLLAVQTAKTTPAITSLPPFKDMPAEVLAFRRILIAETDRACALHAAQYLDNALETLLRASLIEDDQVTDSMFRGTGPLATFSARIDLAYLRGLISSETRRDLTLIRRVRNEFAHHASHIRFTYPPVESRCLELTQHSSLQATPRARFCSSVLAVLGLVHAMTKAVQRPTPAPSFDHEKIRKAVTDVAMLLMFEPSGGEETS